MMNENMGVSVLALVQASQLLMNKKVMSINEAMAGPDKKEWEALVQHEFVGCGQ